MDFKASPQQEVPNYGRGTNGNRVYQVWKGSNRFFCGGRLVFGPDVRSMLLTLFLILAPIVVFCAFVGRHLLKDFPSHGGVAIMVVAVTFTCSVLSFLLLTSSRDPGIIPRNSHPPEPEEEEEGGSSSDWSGTHTPKLRLPRTKDVIVNGVVVKTKYCDTCMLYRPPRCSHCSICNNCVERFDHHCPWVGQCIGQRNYRYFFLFIVSSTLLCFFVFAMCVLRIKKVMDGDSPHTVWKALRRSPASAALLAYAFLATWFVGGLTVFHTYLMATNQTTYENFRYRYENKVNPYDKGIASNVKEILCLPIPPSKVNFRAKVQEKPSGFGRFTGRQSEHTDILSPSMAKQREHMDILHPKTAQQRGHIDISSPKNAIKLNNAEMGLRPTLTHTSAHHFTEGMEVAHQRGKGFNNGTRHGFHDPYVEKLDNPYKQEWQDVSREITYMRNSSLGVQNEVSYSRHGCRGHEGRMVEFAPQMPHSVPGVARQGSLGWPGTAPFINQ